MKTPTLAVSLITLLYLIGCSKEGISSGQSKTEAQRPVPSTTAEVAASPDVKLEHTTKSGLKYEIIAAGNGPAVQTGRSVRIHETMTLADGTLLYSTRPKNNPVKFLVGSNQVIAGVDEGVVGMRVGERRKLIVPPSLSKRSEYPPNIPPDAILHYDIELVEIFAK